MKVIFLDLDGVLNSDSFLKQARLKSAFEKDADEIDPACVVHLNTIIQQTKAKVVISSSWRIIMKWERIRDLLREHGFVGEVIGVTPSINKPGRIRGDEIAAWLMFNEHGTPEDFVILDDDADMGELVTHLIQTDPATGLTAPNAQSAIDLLNRDSK